MNELLGGNTSYLSWEVTGRNITYLAGETAGYFFLVLLSESIWLRLFAHTIQRHLLSVYGVPPPSPLPPDIDVEREAELIRSADPEHYMLTVIDLIKSYPSDILCAPPKHAVRGVTLGCAAGERFGLLG